MPFFSLKLLQYFPSESPTLMEQKQSGGGRIENILQLFPLSYIVYECSQVLPTQCGAPQRLTAFGHRNHTINRKRAYILADVLAMDNLAEGAATRHV
jgi:hypothetical protein